MYAIFMPDFGQYSRITITYALDKLMFMIEVLGFCLQHGMS